MSEETPITDNTKNSSIAFKDLLIPLSIVIAGSAVGLGLYFGAGSSAPAAPAKQANQEAPAPDTTDKINPVTEEDWIKGNINAPVKIVEYSDFECPFCKRHHETMKVIAEKYGD